MSSTVAIILRTRDREVLLRRSVASVAEQSYRDYTLVVVNDGGDPATVESVIADFPGLASSTIVHNTESVGREEAVNVGAAADPAVAADYLAILDDDDSWAPDYLRRTVEALDASDDGGVAVRTEVVYERIDGDTVVELGREILKSDSDRVTLTDTVYANWVPPTSLVVRRALFAELDGWNGSLPVLADWDFNLRLLSRATIGFIDGEPLAFWHWRQDQAGALANSVVELASVHTEYALLIRDSYLRSSGREAGDLGLLLFIAESFRRQGIAAGHSTDRIVHASSHRFDQLDARLDLISEHLKGMAEAMSGMSSAVERLEQRITELEGDRFSSKLVHAAQRAKRRMLGRSKS
ncbi:glycosyltransferase family 2 protein [Agromyces sp. NPDC058136]|uniref:glycosyltransferase family 2 protein n=1 Tax=Agromyces sp. NPDC058136 TaxID=3346354 RepID=UPI0036D82ECB